MLVGNHQVLDGSQDGVLRAHDFGEPVRDCVVARKGLVVAPVLKVGLDAGKAGAEVLPQACGNHAVVDGVPPLWALAVHIANDAVLRIAEHDLASLLVLGVGQAFSGAGDTHIILQEFVFILV